MKILVTGSEGYIGKRLVPELTYNGHEIICVDRVFSNDSSFVHGDVRSKELIEELIDKVDCVIPLAGLVGYQICNKFPMEANEVNFESIIHILSCLKDKMILYPNTNSGYGNENPDIPITEEHPLKPISIYGKTKVDAEGHVNSHENSVCFRFATVFGVSPKMRDDLLVNQFTKLATMGETLYLYEPNYRRNFIYIGDVVRLFLFTLDNFDDMKGNIFNAGLNEANLTKEELCLCIKDIVPTFEYSIVDGIDPDQRNYLVSNDKLKRFGFEAKFSLNRGIEQLVSYWRMCMQ